MSEPVRVTSPLDPAARRELRAGDRVLLTGPVYTARDAAHKRLVALIDEGKPFPFEMAGAVIYYVGPSPARPGDPIGSAGPTTSYRMDAYAPALLARGLAGMIGKGMRNADVKAAMVEHGAVYFAATGGAGALLAAAVKAAVPVAYEDLGPEAILRLEVTDMPLVVVNDAHGGDLYDAGVAAYEKGFPAS